MYSGMVFGIEVLRIEVVRIEENSLCISPLFSLRLKGLAHIKYNGFSVVSDRRKN